MAEDKQEDIPFNGEDITPNKDGCLLKELVREGTDDELPYHDDKVYIHYIGRLPDGTVFEDTHNRPQPVTFNVGRGDFLKAWDIGVATMKRGEIARFLSKPKYAYGLKGLEGKVPSATSVIFEIELLNFEGRDISRDLDRTILRRVIKKGDVYEMPNEDATIEIKIKGSYKGEVYDDRTVTYIGGAGIVDDIPYGVEQACFRMINNEVCRLYLSGDATKGVEKFGIPPGDPVVYEVTMVKFTRAKRDDHMNDEQKLAQSELFKERADKWVKLGFYDLAIKRYKNVFNTLLNATLRSDVDSQKSRSLKFASQLNLALCYLKVGNYPECKRACGMALAFDPKCEKALFRRGQALLLQRFFKEAIEDFEAVLESNPSNEAAKQQIEQCHREIKAFKVKEREMYNSFLLRKKAEKFDDLETTVT